MDDLSQLRAIRSRTLGLIAEITAVPKPTYSVDGQSVSWNDYLQQLRETVEWCERRLAAAEGGGEFRTVAET